MNIKIINDLYKKILDMDNGAQPIKFDLHIHTPGSNDYSIPKGFTIDETYIKILDEALENEIKIIAITDHNTFTGYNKIKEISEKNNKYNEMLILCGIEITCFSKHILAIFDKGFSKKNQEKFLEKIGLIDSEQGDSKMLADELTPSNLLKEISNFGGISILAHVDAENGFIFEYCKENKVISEISFSGKSLGKILNSSYLYGMQIVNEKNRKKIEALLLNESFKRKDRLLSFLQFSDSHGVVLNGNYTSNSGSRIGENNKYSVAKMSDITFSALKLVLLDPETRILDNYEQKHNYPIILGVSINSPVFSEDGEFINFRFNDEMNCIIGARGTGKSTILEIVKRTLLYDYKTKKKNIIDENDVINRFCQSVVFLKFNNSIYAFYYKPQTYIEYNHIKIDQYRSIRKIYKYNNKTFDTIKKGDSLLQKEVKKIMISNYGQRQLYEYSKNPNKIMEIIDDFLIWQKPQKISNILRQIKYQQNILEEIVDNINKKAINSNKSFVDELYDSGKDGIFIKASMILLKNINGLSNMRKEMINTINKILIGKIKLSTTRIYDETINNYLLNEFPETIRKNEKKSYEYQIDISKVFENVIAFSHYVPEFDFWIKLLQQNYDEIKENYNLLSHANINDVLLSIRKGLTGEEFLFDLTDSLEMQYNVNSGKSSGNQVFRKNNQLSLGQNAVALLLLILSVADNSKDSRPLIMDQPEDDLDNSYIYNTLVKEFRKVKNNRQLLISTHNANIPVSSDSENIIVLRYNGKFGYNSCNGSIDKNNVVDSVLEILEGGEEAFIQRSSKYNG